jgi:hypothetical protein
MNDTITFQQIIVEGRRELFVSKVNELLMDGWRVVPGAYRVDTVEKVADPNTPAHLITPAGTVFLPFYFIALERSETKSLPAMRGGA